MGLLDKLKPLPRWKHADPVIRLEAVRELEDPAELAVLAETDPDARIRRAATARVSEPALLGRLAAGDVDQDVRDRAADRLLVLACRADRGQDVGPDGDAAALAAVRALADPRRLSTVAKSDAPDAIRAEALAGISDPRALGALARHAKAETTAAAALDRLSALEHAELLETALHSDHRDVALRAFDRLVEAGADAAVLKSIEAKADHKPVSRRARTLIQEIEHAEAARRSADEERRRRETSLCIAMEQAADLVDPAVARAELGRVHDAWRALDVSDAATVERFSQAHEAAEAAVVKRQQEADLAADRERQRAEIVATCNALCLRVETIEGDDVLEQLNSIEEEWRPLLPVLGAGPEADRLAERFALAVAACRKRHELGAALAETRAKLDALVATAEQLTSDADVVTAAARWHALSREARGLTAVLNAASRPAEDLTSRLDAAGQLITGRAAERQAAADAEALKAQLQLVQQLLRLADRARRVSEADTVTLKEGEHVMRDIAAGLESASQTPSRPDLDDAVSKLRTLQEAIAPRVRELREMDDWRRFANAQRQEQLIAMAEAIVTSLTSDDEAGRPSDLAATARALRELHTKWQEVAEAPRQTAQKLWDRFRRATDFIRTRCEPHFAKVRQERQESLDRKASIVTEAEALAASSDWAKAAARFQELQVEWQALGPVSRDTGREMAQRFRAACNAFFGRRREDLTTKKQVWAENLAKKEALCDRAEALAASTDWDAAASEIKRMQVEWKSIGPVRRNKSDVVWNRFRAAADQFFERFHHRHEITLATKLAEREALVVELEAIDPAATPESPAEFGQRVQLLRTTWNRSVPIPAPGMKVLADRWQNALARLVATKPEAFAGTDVDPAAVVDRMEKLVARVESFLSGLSEGPKGLSPTEMLAAKLRTALASNAMGGRASDDAKWTNAASAVRDAQAAWERLGPTTLPAAQALETRFREACRRVNDQARKNGVHGPSRQDAPRAQGNRPSHGPRESQQRRPERQTAAVG